MKIVLTGLGGLLLLLAVSFVKDYAEELHEEKEAPAPREEEASDPVASPV